MYQAILLVYQAFVIAANNLSFRNNRKLLTVL